MKTFTKADAIHKATKCALDYKKYLSRNKFLVVYKDQIGAIGCFEMSFPDYAFMHLTGIKLSEGSQLHSARDFFDACCKSKLSPEDIIDPYGTDAKRKLSILPTLINFIHYSKMTLVFNNGRPVLKCDRVIGTTNYCLALDLAKTGYYVPVSCLNEDIRDFGNEISRVIAVFQADLSESTYSCIKSVAKGVNLKNISYPGACIERIDLTNYREPTK